LNNAIIVPTLFFTRMTILVDYVLKSNPEFM
jgi:hypothetical protein